MESIKLNVNFPKPWLIFTPLKSGDVKFVITNEDKSQIISSMTMSNQEARNFGASCIEVCDRAQVMIDEYEGYFGSRGIGSEWLEGCAFCNYKKQGLYPNIAAFVKTKEDGEAITRLFPGYAKLDFREREPDWIQVKIGECRNCEGSLKKLAELVRDNEKKINKSLIEKLHIQ